MSTQLGPVTNQNETRDESTMKILSFELEGWLFDLYMVPWLNRIALVSSYKPGEQAEHRKKAMEKIEEMKAEKMKTL